MAKKKRELVGQERQRFVAGCVDEGISERLAGDLFDLIEPFADYGFPAAHACAYGFIAYQTAYLIAQHPVEYMAAILTSVKDDKDRKPYYLYACRSMKNRGPASRRERVRHGLRARTRRSSSDPVRALGGPQRRGGCRASHPGRSAVGGPFDSFADVCRRVDPGALTKRVLESLIFAGAFDSFGYTRGGMVQQSGEQAAWEKVAAPILAERKAQAAGQFSLFGTGADGAGLGRDRRGGPPRRRARQRLLLRPRRRRCSASSSPTTRCSGWRTSSARRRPTRSMRSPNLGDGDLVTVGGIIGSLARKYTKRGEPYAQFRLEGLAGGVEVIAFPGVYEAVPQLDRADTIVLSHRSDRPSRPRAADPREQVKEPALGPDAPKLLAESLVVDLAATACTPAVLEKLKQLFEAHPGAAPVRLRFLASAGVTPLSVGSFNVDAAGSLMGELHDLRAGSSRVDRSG